MSVYLSCGGFKWLKNVDGFGVTLISKKSQIAYILKFDVAYPDELHELYNDYPLASEKLAVSYDMLSKDCKKIAGEYEIKVKQSDWMKKYINFNTEKRKNAANDFEKDFFKLMINSVYGKTIEN